MESACVGVLSISKLYLQHHEKTVIRESGWLHH